MTTVSIAMTTYNGGRFLREQLRSLATQHRLPDELVVSDDGSNDDTIQILEEFRSSAPFPVHIHTNSKRLGVNQNFGRCLSLCKGDIVFICDQDDVWGALKLERIVSQMQREGAYAGLCNAIIMSTDPGLDGATTIELEEARVAPAEPTLIGGCTSALRADFLKLALPIPEGAAYDVWLNGLAAMLGLQTVLREPLQQWRHHENNTSTYLRKRPSSQGATNPASNWPAEIVLLRKYAEVLERLGNAIPAARVTAQALKSTYLSKAEALDLRLSVLRKPRLARLLTVARMYFGGGYRQFNSGRSALGDLIRR